MNETANSPWICHVCDTRSTFGEGQACSVCFKITCPAHLQIRSVYNPDSRLYELRPICLFCATPGLS